MKLEEAKQLKYRDIIHVKFGPDCEGWRVNGKTKVWKRSPDRVRVPLKRGLYEHGYLTENNLSRVHLASACPQGGHKVLEVGWLWKQRRSSRGSFLNLGTG